MSWWVVKNMKWQMSSADFLSEKTFLIIKDNLETLEAKETSTPRKKTICAGNTGTWPPKMKKISSSRNVTDRPQTANLEKPSVLNPDLVDKLDMSLLSKELFCDSMSRIQLGGVLGGGASSTSSSSPRRRWNVPIDTELHRYTRIGFTKRSTRKKRPSFHHSTDDFSRVDLTHLEPPSMQLQKLSKSGSRKTDRRLDNNNNGSGSSLQSKISSLSKLKRKGVKSKISSDVELFTAYAKRAPEPCKTCGRPNQPERFHSHPKAPILKSKTERNGLKLNKIFVAKKSVQKPVALNFRSDKNKKMEKNLATKAMSDSKSKTPSPFGRKGCPGSPSKVGETMSLTTRGPRTVTCYICSREFGTASFPIHEPKCLQKWERENKVLPPSQRRPVPQRPNVAIDHRDWNATAWERSQTQLVPCSRCGKTFLPDRLIIHQKSCKVVSKNSETENRDLKANCVRPGPPTVLCEICGRNFGTRSIKIHEPQCLKKWHFENNKLPRSQRKVDPHKKGDLVTRSEDEMSTRKLSTFQESPHKNAFSCYICDKNFGSASIAIHETQCLKKWHIENNKLPLHKRRKEPQKPDNTSSPCSSSGKSSLTAAELAELNWKQHLDKLVPCKRCGRTFNPDRVAIHERSCKGTR